MNSRIKSFITGLESCQISNKQKSKGFTLLELLIVVSIIAILSVALVLVLDPSETLKKSRDSQRISDLSTMKTALGIYTTSTTTPYLGGNASNATCKTLPSTAWANPFKIFYSSSGTTITDATLDGGSVNVASTSTTPTLTDSTGWIPVNLDSLTGGSPISNLPLDPVNTITTPSAITSADLVYRYACSVTPFAYEIDAVLESNTYTTGSDNKLTKDGGNNSTYYEVGTNLRILGTGADF